MLIAANTVRAQLISGCFVFGHHRNLVAFYSALPTLSVSVFLCVGLTMCQGRNPVFWHLIGMSTAPEIHSIQFQDHSLTVI